MNLLRHRIALTQLAMLVALSACVSLNIAPQKGERSRGVHFMPPPRPYLVLKSTTADAAWQNKENGNSISFFSNCNEPSPQSLEAVSRELFLDLRDLKVLRRELRLFNAREALDIEVEGRVEGVPTRVRAVIFQKNGCTYTLSHVGLPTVFETDREFFDGFLRSFQAP